MSFKVFEPALRFNLTNYAITPDEQDAYVTYTAANVSNDLAFYFLGTAGTAKVQPGTWLTTMPDYPRNAQFSITGTSVGAAGTAIINGKDQFGVSTTETLGFGSTDNGAAVVGTQVWAQITSGTFYYGTAVGNGTLRFGFGTGGTTCLFGLPVKVGGTSDLILYSWGSASTPVKVGGGTVGSMINTTLHAIKAASDIAGSTTSFSVWVKSTFNGEGTTIAALTPKV